MKRIQRFITSFFVYLVCAAYYSAYAQVSESSPFLKFSSVTIGLQLWSPSEPAPLDKLKLLAKDENDFTPIDLSDYQQGQIKISASAEDGEPFELPNNKVSTSTFLSKARFYAQAGFIPYSKKKNSYLANRELLFGIYYQPYVYHTADFLDRDTIRVDSIIGKYVYYTEWTPVLGLTGDYIFKTDPEKRVGVFFGGGVGIGFGVHPEIIENQGTFIQTIHTDTFVNGISTVHYFETLSDTSKNIAAVSSLLLELRFPFGASLRIAEGFSLLANAEGKISKQVYLNGQSFPSRFGIAGTVGIRYEF